MHGLLVAAGICCCLPLDQACQQLLVHKGGHRSCAWVAGLFEAAAQAIADCSFRRTAAREATSGQVDHHSERVAVGEEQQEREAQGFLCCMFARLADVEVTG